MDFTADFFRDEVRNGFYIPTAIKQAWAASLTVLSEIDRICEKYGITYFADWGTILGAVRHGGFVPWDDDLDICMKRDDYIRFREVADEELPGEFVIHDYERKENHWLFLSRVVNNSKTCFTRKHLDKYHNFPYMCAVDIFIQDYLYKDDDKERERCEEVKRLIAVADGIVEGTLSRETIERELIAIEEKYDTVIGRLYDEKQTDDTGYVINADNISNKDSVGHNDESGMNNVRSIGVELYRLAEQQMARVPKEEADSVGQIFPWILKGQKGLPKEYYEKIIRLPFENTTMPVPAYYDAILRSRYGNYLEIRKVWTGHDYPYFEKQRQQLQAAADYKLPEFSFTDDMRKELLEENRISSQHEMKDESPVKGMKLSFWENSYKHTVAECVEQLCDMTDQLLITCSEENYEEILALLPECQQLAADMGTFIEEIKGEDRESVKLTVSSIQKYCDVLYALYQVLACEDNILNEDAKSELNIAELEDSIYELKDVVIEQVLARKEVLFLSVGPKEWNGFGDIYNSVTCKNDCDVYVVPLPLLFKDSLGRIKASNEEIAQAAQEFSYPKDLMLTEWTNYDVKLHHPDRVYIQNPYDGENPCLTVPPGFYAKEIGEYTDELIYISAFKVDEFHENDYNDIYNMKHYVTAPGVIYADKILVQSENMKKQYVRKLTEFAGEDTEEAWNNKVKVYYADGGLGDSIEYKNPVNEADDDTVLHVKKKIFYCIGLNELSEHRDKIIESVKERFDIFEGSSDSIDVTVAINPIDINEWRKIDGKLAEELFALIHEYVDNSGVITEGAQEKRLYEYWCRLIEMRLEDYETIVHEHDAYYGSASPLVPMFVHEKKPVMISGY
ncbi:MAG: LicD family protein [Lachnospiraceae bacterium]|nr:LicD family protein [Lachnospiraceae bacterium]